MRFTERTIEREKLDDGRKDRLLFDAACPGLGLRLTRQSKVFLYQWTNSATGKRERMPLGAWGALTLDQARDAARVLTGRIAAGGDPRAEQRKAREAAEVTRQLEATTLDALIQQWAALHLANRRPRHAAEAERALRSAFSGLMKRPAASISRADVRDVLDAYAARGRVTMAARVLAYGRACYRWGRKRDLIGVNPFDGQLAATGTTSRERVLSTTETREVWAATGGLGMPFGPVIRFLLLTMARRDEAASATWPEIEGRQWIIPSDRTKNGRPHVVHLSTAALAVLATVPRVEGQSLIFSTTGKTGVSGFSKSKLALDAAITKSRTEAALASDGEPDAMPAWTFHDFRRTGVSFLAAIGVDTVVADKLLNHKPAKITGVAAVYQRYAFDAERAAALDAWAAHVTCADAAVGAGRVRRPWKAAGGLTALRRAGSNLAPLRRTA